MRGLISASVLILVCLDASAVTIRLKPEAEVDGPRITLGEVATVADGDMALAAKLERIDLGRAPWPGSDHRVDGIVVRLKLYQNHIDPKVISVEAVAGCRVTTRPLEIPPERVVGLAQEQLLGQIPWPKDDVELELASKPRGCVVPRGCGQDVLRPGQINAANLRGSVEVSVDVVVDGEARLKLPVRFNIKLYERVAVATKAIGRNDPFTADNVELKRIEVTNRPAGLLTDTRRVLGRRAAHPIAADTPLARTMIVAPPVVKRGDSVRIVLQVGGLEITARGTARQDGAEGDIIRVENADSGRQLSGRVVDAQTVAVEG